MTNVPIGPGTKLPNIPHTAVTDPQIKPVVEAVKTIFNTRAFNKDPLERWVTWRDLVDNNVVVYRNGGNNFVGGSGNNIGFLPLPGGEDDFTPPPAPTGLSIDGAFNNIILEWDDPTSAYSNHSFTEIWRSATNNLGTAVLTGTAPGAVYADSVGNSNTYYYWIRFVSKANVVGPYNSLIGTIGQTALDPGYLLETLTGAITETQLFASLGERINLIDAPASTPNSVAARVQAEASARAQAILNEASSRSTADSALQGQINTLSASTTTSVNNLTAAIQAEQTARTNAISAEASSRETLATQMRGSYTGTDLTQLTTGLLFSERQARSTEDAALASSISALSSTVTTNNNTLTAAISSEATTRANADTALTNSVNSLSSTVTNNFNTLNAAITSEASTRANADSALSNQVNTVQASLRSIPLALPLEQWVLNGQSIVTIPDGRAGNTALRLSGNFGYPNQGTFVAINPGKRYRVRFWARPSSNAAGLLYFSLRQFTSDNALNPGPINGGRSPYKPSGQNRAGHIAAYGDTWGEYNFIWSTSDWQPGVKYFQPEFLDNYSGQAGHWDIQGLTITDVSDVEDVSAAVQTEASARINADNSLFAQYTVKVDVNGYVSGFGLASTSTGAAPTSDFIIRADRFSVASPNGPGIAPIVPFVVNTTAQVINGVSVPAGVYMDAAFIKNGTITNAKIGNAAIDSAKIANAAIVTAKIGDAQITGAKIENATITGAKIAVATITAANIANATIGSAQIGTAAITNANIANAAIDSAKISNTIQSDNYSSTAGWQINKSGTMFLNQANIRGELNVGEYNGYAWPASGNGVHISRAGILVGNANGGGRYMQIYTPAGDNNAYIYTNIPAYLEDGQITAAKIGNGQITNAKIGDAAVNTLKLDGNSVTISASASGASSASFTISTSYGGVIVFVMSTNGVDDWGGTTSRLYVNGGLYHSYIGHVFSTFYYSNDDSGTGSYFDSQTSSASVYRLPVGPGTYNCTLQSGAGPVTFTGLLTQR